MNEIAILSAVVGVLWGLILALAGVIWATLRTAQASTDAKVLALETRASVHSEALGRLDERVNAHEKLDEQQHDNVNAQFERIENTLSEIANKLDRVLGGRYPSPLPQEKKP